MVDEIITRQELINAKRDARDLGKAANEKLIVSPRYGDDFKSLPMIADEAQATIGEWESAIALITQDGGVPALAVSDASGDVQQTVNLKGAAIWYARQGGYSTGDTARLANGDIVKSTIDGNTNDPNEDMTGWVNPIKNLSERWVFVEDFGAKPSPFDSTSAFNEALSASKHVMTRGGVQYDINGTLNFNNQGTALFLASGTRIVSSLTNTTLFSLNATNCKIYSFGGEVVSPEQHIGTQGAPTFGVVRLNANDCVVDGVRFKNYYRFCIQINNTTRHTIKRNSFDGNVPYSFYIENDSNTLSRGAISYDNPPASTELNPFLNISDNHLMNDVQGIMSGNFGATGNPYGVRVVNNSFYNMYDHAMYLDGVSADYAVISNNTMIECRRPIVAGGTGTVITGNTFKGITQTKFFEQYISLRDPVNCIVSNNTFDGWGAGIALQGIINTQVSGNIISNNIFNQTGPSLFNCVIRIYATDTVDDNSVIGNTLKGYPGKLFGSIFIDATNVGRNNKVKGNTIHFYSDGYALYLKNQTGGDFSGNELLFSYDSDVAITVAMLSLLNIKNSTIKNNAFRCVDKGANVTLRGVQSEATSSWNSVEGNTFELTAPSLAAKFPLFNFSASNNLRNNILDVTVAMSGSFQLGLANTIVISNKNITAASTIIIQPKTSAAAALMASQGFYITPLAGSFTFAVGGAAPTVATDWNYVIL